MFSQELNKQLDRLAKESEKERSRHERHYGLMQEMLKAGRAIMPTVVKPKTDAKTLATLLRHYDVEPSKGSNPWLNVCRLVVGMSKRKYQVTGSDFDFIEGYAGYLRFFDENRVSTPGRLKVSSFVAAFSDPEFGTGLTAIKDRDTKDHRITRIMTQTTVVPQANGLPQEIQAVLDAQAEAIKTYANADGTFNAMFIRLVVGDVRSSIKLLEKIKARTSV